MGGMAELRIMDRLADALHMRRAFGEPIERDGVLVIPVARVVGGGGGGEAGQPADVGMGFGGWVTPTGVFVLKDGQVRWEPAFDLNRVVLGGQLLAALVILTVRAALKRRD
jgi:uncharacterized spore protein YtfJ